MSVCVSLSWRELWRLEGEPVWARKASMSWGRHPGRQGPFEARAARPALRHGPRAANGAHLGGERPGGRPDNCLAAKLGVLTQPGRSPGHGELGIPERDGHLSPHQCHGTRPVTRCNSERLRGVAMTHDGFAEDRAGSPQMT